MNVSRVGFNALVEFCTAVLMRSGCREADARIAAVVLVEADARGIESHGVARLSRYVKHIADGTIDPSAIHRIVHETPVSAVVDGCRGMGQAVAKAATELALRKAGEAGIGVVVVRNSNHFGIAGYYAEMAAVRNLIGVALTNTAPLVVPTHARVPLLGTNPIAVAVPALPSRPQWLRPGESRVAESAANRPVLIDMATSVVPRGKVEVCARKKSEMPEGWATDESGHSCRDPEKVLKLLAAGAVGGILPVGGEGEEHGGHRGYGMALLVELLTGGLAQGCFSPETYRNGGGICHFFAAVSPRLFGEPAVIYAHIEKYIVTLRNAPRADGAERVYVHGDKEWAALDQSMQLGVPIEAQVIDELAKIGQTGEPKVAFPQMR